MAKKIEKCFFCNTDVNLSEHHYVITGPDGKRVYSCPYHKGLVEHGGIEVNAPESEPEEKEVIPVTEDVYTK